MFAHLIISGRVQGVGFRYAARQAAMEHKLVGWVHNKADGTVEMEIVGDKKSVEHYVEDLKSGLNPFIRIDDIKMETSPTTNKHFDSFSIR